MSGGKPGPCRVTRHAPGPPDLLSWPSLGHGASLEGHHWTLLGPDCARVKQHHSPRFATTDMQTLRQGAIDGLGVVQLPTMMMNEPLADGRLVRLLPDWAPRQEVIHAVFPSRRGLLPAIRALIDHLVEGFSPLGQASTPPPP
ncbi:LysR substrate-binding domain-containing protein [Aeromonas caviae]|uniref:LysR substrate-binding domain-containing protein n=1 Tax=Aeromonas caviae TaxID=648 RepID=UPI002B466792|nr:LysR substrate-binding domain-containing protein [Aeromonas caviae]